MRGWLTRSMVVVLAIACLLTAGCLFGGLKNIESLQLSASPDVLAFGERATLSATGKTKMGKTVSVIPEWTLVEGVGTLGKTDFQASNWDYEGPVVLKATYNGVSSEITLTINGLLGDYGDPFPTPSSPWSALPSKTEPKLVEIGDPVDFFSHQVFLRSAKGDVMRGNARFVWDGEIMLPDDPSPWTWLNPKLYDKLPEIPRLSHKVHFERLESQILGRGTNYEKSVSNRHGTTVEESTELFKRLTSTTSASANWGWGEISTTLELEISQRTKQSIKVEKEQTVTRTWSFINPNDFDMYLYSAWNKVDTFYLSDSKGVPLEDSEIFEGYGFTSSPMEIRGDVVVQKTWGFND